MKRLLLTTIILTTALSFIPQAPAHAGFWADYKAKIEYKKDLRNEQKSWKTLSIPSLNIQILITLMGYQHCIQLTL